MCGKKCSTSPIIREMQLKITIRCNLTSVRIVKIKGKQMLKKIQRKGALTDCWWEYWLIQPLWKIAWNFLKKKKPTYDSAIPLLEIYPKRDKSGIQRDNQNSHIYYKTSYKTKYRINLIDFKSIREFYTTNNSLETQEFHLLDCTCERK